MRTRKAVLLDKLTKELQQAGFATRGLATYKDAGDLVLQTYDASGVSVDLPPGAQAVIDAHDGTAPPTPDYADQDTPADQLADAVTTLRGYLALPSPTNTQTVGAFKILVRVVLYILRNMR